MMTIEGVMPELARAFDDNQAGGTDG